MTGKLLAFLIVVYVIGMLLGSTMDTAPADAATMDVVGGEAKWVGASANESMFDFLMNFNNAVQHNPIVGDIPLGGLNGSYFLAWFQVITLRFNFIAGDNAGAGFNLFYYIVLMPFAVLGVLSVIMMFIGIVRGNVTWG